MEKDAGKVVEEYISIPSYSVGEDYGDKDSSIP